MQSFCRNLFLFKAYRNFCDFQTNLCLSTPKAFVDKVCYIRVDVGNGKYIAIDPKNSCKVYPVPEFKM